MQGDTFQYFTMNSPYSLTAQGNIHPMCSIVACLGRAVESVLPSAKRCKTRKLTRKRMPIDDGVGQVKQRLKPCLTPKAIWPRV